MIYELQKDQFINCKHLLNKERHIEVPAIIEGNNSGRIFVDNVSEPRSALVWLGNLDGFVFIGDANHTMFNLEIKKVLTEQIAQEAARLDLKWFEGFGYQVGWDNAIREILCEQSYEESNQKVYKLYESTYKTYNEPAIDATYTVLKVTKENIVIYSLLEQSFFVSQITSFWDSVESFFEKGIGHVILHENQVVSLCFSGFVSGNTHTANIETIPEHRGKNLAKKVAHAFVQECFKQGYEPYWDCMEVNKPSIAIAESLGFTNIFDYTVYEYQF
ncbi:MULTISPECIES: GNAT family N-acetyltransferase [Bacillus cereus group]|uniref:GNAT family N-acetyltransferase n=1 Tax=Bacillus cereus TaxID=1396 RepID=A0AA44QE58_BACCE|nr:MULTISPECIES: GNAT family N-acetyltransferase [Bacillus cereus group]PFA25148.1 GNAT family N-acetyltransferase [Bacillus cereus]PFN06253.1 GNAT family N-acetyltransferase [Bacillus cereus]PFO83199.1 GNAT family N-acetyltransferase [Bacillus cereus]PFR33131.1 GNAT family N-acetyltransferase [Bacillus cereus]PFS07669.1 GNAT family N-acetyltransferase [Bacillus cereus]